MDLTEYTGEQSDVSFSKFDTESSLGATLLGVPLAAAVDTGVSIWNSLTPEKYSYSTHDVLANLNGNLATVYDENPETIKALSFVGGLVAPTGLALKGMNMLRSGAKGVNWFSAAGQTQRMANIKAAYEGSGKASSAFRGAMWENRFATAGNALVDATVMEGVMYSTMNAHPFMEDYVKDPLKHASMNILFGFGLMGGAGLIAQRFAAKEVMQGVEQASHSVLLEGMKDFSITENLSGHMAVHRANSQNWKSMLEIRADSLTEHTKKLLQFNIANADAAQFTIFEKMASPSLIKEIEKLGEGGAAYKQTLIDRIASDPVKFANVDTITIARVGDFADLSQASKTPFFGNTTIPGEAIPLTVKTNRVRPVTVAYNPELDQFMMPSEIKNYGSAADLGYANVDELLKGTPKDWHVYPNRDIGIESPFTSSPTMDAHYLKTLAHFDRLSVDELYKPITIAPDDFGMLQGFLTRVKKELLADPGFDIGRVELTIAGVKTDPFTAMETLATDKLAKIKEYIKIGIPDEVISKNLNVPVGTIQKVSAGQPDDLMKLEPMAKYTDASAIQDYLAPTNRTLLLRTNSNKIPHAMIRSNIGSGITGSTDDIVKETFLATSESEMIREAAGFFLGTEFRTLRDVIRDKLNLISNPALGNKFLGSTDHSLRGMKEVGPIATYLGKMRTDLTNRAVDKFFAPVKDDLYTMVRDKAALVEFNTADSVNAGIKGYREYKNRQIWHIDPQQPTKIVPSPGNPNKMIEVPNLIAAKFNGEEFRVTSDSVDNVFQWMSGSGRELYKQQETLRKIPGLGKLSDIGLWVPSFSPKDKYIAYVIDKASQATTLLHGKTPEELQGAIQAFSGKSGVIVGQTHDIIQHGTEQQLFNIIAGRHDPMFMQSADITMLKGGSSGAARISTSTERLVEMVNAYEHQIAYNMGSIMEFQLSDVFDYLHTASKYTQSSVKMQPGASGIIKKTEKDAAAVLMNTIMGKSNLDQYGLWRGTNQIYSAILEKALGTIQEVMEPILNTGKNLFGKGKNLSDKQYEELQKQLEIRGIPNPFKDFQEAEARRLFHQDRVAKTEALSTRVTVLANTLAATTLLRVGELGQAYVNAISLPILMTSEISSKLSAKFMNAELAVNPEFDVVKTIFNGWRYNHRPEALPYIQRAKDLNMFKGVISEADELFARTRSLDPGILSTTESLMRSKLIDNLSKATDFSEQVVREKAFSTGVYIAKTAYPTLPDAGVMVFARDFMDRTIGNYAAAQRPTMFQGTLGVAMGLFQTYMLTMAQSLYRHLEKGEFKALAKTMLAQGTIFGAKSLPGFNIVSEKIGEHFSDDNFDLVTGTFRALPDKLAEAVIYGLPSSFSQAAITTRGEIQPRVPDPFKGIGAIPAVALTGQVYDAIKRVGTAVFQADKTAGQGIFEAISMQSISRPVARMSELIAGYSVTGKGNLVAGPDEIWAWNSVLARGLATRPVQEMRARDAIHLNSMYGSIDRENRQGITMQLRSHLRDGTLNDEVVANLAEQYMRTGSPQGWNSAVNTAIAQTELPANQTVRNYLAPNSPTMLMIDNMH